MALDLSTGISVPSAVPETKMKNLLLVLICILPFAGQGQGETLTLSTMDLRRSPTSAPLIHRTNQLTDAAKTVSFKIYTGDLWENNPQAHLYMLTDGYITPGEPFGSLQGRGIIMGHTPNCKGIGFEQFGVNPGFAEGCIPMEFQANSFYDIVVRTTPSKVKLRIRSKGNEAITELAFTGDYLSNDTIMGVAGDRESATFIIFNLRQHIDEIE